MTSLENFSKPQDLDDLIKKQELEVLPINYLRGANWINKIIVDEAQNFTFKELTTLITRLGENSQLFICGDYMQNATLMAKVDLRTFIMFDDEESQEQGGFTVFYL